MVGHLHPLTDGHPQQHIVGCPVAQQASNPYPQIVGIHNHQWLVINNQVIISYPQQLMVAHPQQLWVGHP